MFKGINDMILDSLFGDVGKTVVRSDCYFHSEWHDMGATIQQCTLAQMGACPCKGCEKFLDRDEARGVVMKYWLEKNKQKGISHYDNGGNTGEYADMPTV